MKTNLKLFFAGGILNFAFAPFYVVVIAFFSFPYLYKKLAAAKSGKQAFWHGWWFGFGHFVFGLYWISNSLLVDLRFAWLIPFAVSLIPSAAAIFIGLVCYVFYKSKHKSIFLFASLWVLAEIARSYFPFGGFPWNLIGYSALFSNYFAQIASIGGVYLASFIIIIISLSITSNKTWWLLILIPAIFIFGYVRVQPTEYTTTKVRIVQPNIAQTLKWDPALLNLNFFDTLALAAGSDADIIVLPESAVPYHINRKPEVAAKIASVLKEGAFIVAGSSRSEDGYKIWNSLFLLDSKGEIQDYYDKHHLVPFGEYVPLRQFLPIEKITPGMIDFTAGTQGKIITSAKYKFLPLICYEVIFPNYAQINSKMGEYDFIVNTTNDGWFGNSTGPQQHLSMTIMRAIEQGKPVLRAANTGVSAIIDPYGRVLASAPYNKVEAIDGFIPAKLSAKTTYSSMGLMAVLLTITLSLALSIVFRALRVKK